MHENNHSIEHVGNVFPLRKRIKHPIRPSLSVQKHHLKLPRLGTLCQFNLVRVLPSKHHFQPPWSNSCSPGSPTIRKILVGSANCKMQALSWPCYGPVTVIGCQNQGCKLFENIEKSDQSVAAAANQESSSEHNIMLGVNIYNWGKVERDGEGEAAPQNRIYSKGIT